ncbi:MAG: RNA polymerase subunit sigma-70 [Promicromonosporaceae bacterium]|nr:RNA polymerase subunit sigma-70 [Promicromonosporaceae bacterium]
MSVDLDLEVHRGELVAYCYRMLGSVHDAEDLVQDTLLRAWRARDNYDPARASVRTWLYRIATNVCLTALQQRARRPLPSGLGAPSTDTETPLVPAPDIPWLEPFPDARYDADVRGDVRLALVAALQLLPAKQRAALVLRDVLDLSAAEVAEQLGTSVAAVNSALQRARAALAGHDDTTAVAEPGDPQARAAVERYVAAFEAADVPAIVRLLTDDVVMEMPPVDLWYRGTGDYGLFLERIFRDRGREWTTRVVEANGQPAFMAFRPGPDGPQPHSVQVLTVRDGLVARNAVFADPSVVGLFLPR